MEAVEAVSALPQLLLEELMLLPLFPNQHLHHQLAMLILSESREIATHANLSIHFGFYKYFTDYFQENYDLSFKKPGMMRSELFAPYHG